MKGVTCKASIAIVYRFPIHKRHHLHVNVNGIVNPSVHANNLKFHGNLLSSIFLGSMFPSSEMIIIGFNRARHPPAQPPLPAAAAALHLLAVDAVLILLSSLPTTAQGNSPIRFVRRKSLHFCARGARFSLALLLFGLVNHACSISCFAFIFWWKKWFFCFVVLHLRFGWMICVWEGLLGWFITVFLSVLNFVDHRRRVVHLISSSLFLSLFFWHILSFALVSHLYVDFLLFTDCFVITDLLVT